MSEGPVATGAAMLDAANSGDQAPSVGNTPVAEPTQSYPQSSPQPVNNQPPYHQQLEQIPEGFRPLVEPVFKDWDAQVTKKLQEVHSRYEPWKQFVDAQIEPGQVQEAMQLMELFLTNPQHLYQAMGERLGFAAQQAGAEQGQGADEEEIDLGDTPQFDLEKDPRFKAYAQQQQQLQHQQQIILEQMQAARQQQEEAEAEAWLNQRTEQITNELQQKGIEPDWDYIMAVATALIEHRKMGHDEAINAAVEQFVGKVQSYMARPTANRSAPMVLPTHGGTPSNQTPAFESGKDRRAYGAAALQAALRNG